MVHSKAESLPSSRSNRLLDWCYFCCSVLDCLWTFITGPSMLSPGRWPSLTPLPTAPAGAPRKQTTRRCHAQRPSEPPYQELSLPLSWLYLIHPRSTSVQPQYPTPPIHPSLFLSNRTSISMPIHIFGTFFIGCFVICCKDGDRGVCVCVCVCVHILCTNT